jgi:glucokinase
MTNLALGVVIGGTKIAVGLIEASGHVEHRVEVPTPAQEGADAIVAAVLAAARVVMVGQSIVACGVGTAGVVSRAGEIVSATDLLRGWAGTPLALRLKDSLHAPVAVLNDVHATALCEARVGAARGHASALVVAVGTGIGGALVREGTVVHGAHGIAGSIGHTPCVIRSGRRCSCGALDHVEVYASGPAMEADYARRAGVALGLRGIVRRMEQGDEVSRSVVSEAATALGAAIGGANNVADTDLIVIGGGVASIGDLYLEPVCAAARAEALGGSKEVRIVRAQFSADACLVGAGLAGLSLHETTC